MTGFNLPPGCTYKMLDDAMGVDAVCGICFEECESCICPECSKCSSHGDPNCYVDAEEHLPHFKRKSEHHGLRFSTEQLIKHTQQQIRDLKDQIADHESYIQWLIEDKQGRGR